MSQPTTETKPLDEVTRDRLRAATRALGAGRARTAIGLARHTFDRAVGGLPIRAGSRALVEQLLTALEREVTSPERTPEENAQ